MGSIDGFAKGQQPMLDRIKQLNEEHNKRSEAIIGAAPFWRKLLFMFGFHKQFWRWCHAYNITSKSPTGGKDAKTGN